MNYPLPPFIDMAYLLILSLWSILAIYRTWLISRAAHLHQDIFREVGGYCESIGFIGFSIICDNIRDIAHISQLLGSAYNRYEVILTINSAQHPQAVEAIIKHYRMVSVNHSPYREITTPRINNLYRSTSRVFRRLVMVDCSTTDYCEALNTALSFTAYDYIIPLDRTLSLMPHTIETLAITLSDSSLRHHELLYSNTFARCYVFHRDSLISRGGFSIDTPHLIPRKATLCLHSPLACIRNHNKRLSRGAGVVLTSLFTISFTLLALLLSPRLAIATLLCFLLLFTSSRYIFQKWQVENCSVRAILCQISNITMFFKPRKFNIS